MDGIYHWLRNITCYLLFISVLENLLPGKKYGKFLKLFAGMVLILLVIQPFTDVLRLEDQIARNYEAFVFRDQADDLKQELLGIEEQRLEKMIEQYESAVSKDVEQMAAETGLELSEIQVTIDSDLESRGFGTVTGIRILTQGEKEEEESLPILSIDPIQIGKKTSGNSEVSRTEIRAEEEAQQEAIRALRRKIASYYSLEETYVEIQVVERKG